MGRHFAFVSMPASGHVTPTLPLVGELVRRGHRVSYATGPEMLDVVRAAGADAIRVPLELPSGPPRVPGRTPGPEALTKRIDSIVRSVENTFPVLAARFDDDRPDAVCGDAMTPVTPLVAQQLGARRVALFPSFASNEHFSLREQFAHSPGAQAARTAFTSLGEQIGAFAAGHGLDYDPGWVFTGGGELNLVFVPREFQPAGDTFDESFVFLGPAVRDDPGTTGWEPRDPDAPLLLVALGTVFNDRPDFYRTCVEAFTGTGWQVVIAIGDHVRPDDLGPLPDNVEVHPHVPQVRILSRATAFVTHHGMNSTMEALWFGVPLIGLPQMPEQEANARRVQELGYGRRLDPDRLDATTLRTTVDAVAGDDDVRAAVRRMSALVRARNGPATGADALERLVTA